MAAGRPISLAEHRRTQRCWRRGRPVLGKWGGAQTACPEPVLGLQPMRPPPAPGAVGTRAATLLPSAAYSAYDPSTSPRLRVPRWCGRRRWGWRARLGGPSGTSCSGRGRLHDCAQPCLPLGTSGTRSAGPRGCSPRAGHPRVWRPGSHPASPATPTTPSPPSCQAALSGHTRGSTSS